ncbi:MAG: Ig-like domain-containing protein [Gemmatimonadales bacterium]|nr:Ig-like domain-containing protein [Gemmatimonadales bacterium]
MRLGRLARAPRRALALLAGVLGLSLLSCGREVTGPDGGALRFADGLSFAAEFPAPLRNVADGAGSVIPFERVRVTFRRVGDAVALDTVITFGASVDSIAIAFRVPLSANAPTTGEPLTLSLAFVNAAGDTVFRGGPAPVLARALAPGEALPAPIPVTLRVVGVNADARSVSILPESLTVVAGSPFTFSGTAYDAQGAPLSGVALVYTMLDPTLGALTNRAAGSGTVGAARGMARVRVELASGAASDTSFLTILPRPGALALVSGGTQTASVGAALAQPVVVRLTATDGQPLAGAAIAAAVTTGGGAVTPLGTVTDSVGVFRFNWQLGSLAGAQTATVTTAGVTPLVITATATSSGAVQLRITQQIGATYQAGDSIPALLVEARNVSNARDTTYADSVTLSFAVNPTGATLIGTTRVAAVAGVARFDNFRVQRAGTGYRLRVTAAGLGADTSATFAITARAASLLTLQSGGSQVAPPSTALPQPVVVRVTDAFANPIAGVTVAFAVASGSVSAATVNTDAAGLASVTWTLGSAGGAQALTVTSAGLTGSPLTVLANNVGGAVATTTVAPAFDTLTAIGATRTLAATARDAGNAVVPGVYTWLSRTPAVATVDSTGRVTAVADGTAWVVATEAGGTRDSSRIVVQQRLATINVTPGTRNVYLSGTAPFTASAVDGLGVPLTVQPTITWSTASSAIASITAGGVATGVGLGSTQVRATSGTITGVATLNVLTPILRIAVVRDSIGFTVSDTFSLASLSDTRSYRAVAYDTLDAVMTGVTFTWASSNPSVASLDSITTSTARATALANGFTAIRATAQGVTGAAALTVQQVMRSIVITPASVTVAVTGSAVLTARRRDARNFFIPGGTFTFASAATGTATVSATGVVTGVSLGSTTVTATIDTITSAPATVTVAATVPPAISFGRDTLAIGRSGTNVAIPVYLSTPAGNAVTVNLAVADTFAFFNPTSISIPAGQTVGTALLNGRNAGTTQVFAVDAGAVYAGDTAVLAVQASVSLVPGSYSMVVNDERPGQVLLTDPAPAGGTFITFTHGTPGRVSVSPDPAFIPAGQLSANIVIRGLTAGSTTLTPAATGVNGVTANVTTSAAVIQNSPTSFRMGAGQFYQNTYAYVSQNLSLPLTVTLSSSDTSVARVPASVTIPAGTYYVYYDVTARAVGSATITATAPGWTGFTTPVVVTTPGVTLSGGGTYNTTQPAITVYAYARDSVGNYYPRTSALSVQLSSSDTTVLRVLTPNLTIPAGQYYTLTPGQVISGGTPGTARLRVTASGHRSDSTSFTFVGPRLQFSWGANVIGAGQRDQNLYVYTPNNVTAPLTVNIANSDSSFAAAPTNVTIPAGTYYAYFTVRGKSPGLSTFIATAAGHSSDTATYRVTTPRIQLSGGTTLNRFGAPAGLNLYTTDSLGNVHERTDSLVVTYSSANTSVVTVTAADTIDPGLYYANSARVTAVDTGTTLVTATAPGHGTSSTSFTVVTPKLNISFATYRIGRRQYRPPSEQYVYIPNATGTPVVVTFTQSNAAVDSLSSTTVTIPGNTYYAYFGFAGLQAGVDTIIASATGYLPDTAVVVVTSPRLTVAGGLPGTATTTSPPSTVTLYTADSLGNAHYSLDTLLLSAASSNAAVIQPDSVGFRLPRGAYYVQPRVNYVGPGSASMTYADSMGSGYGTVTTNTVTVTGPSLSLYNGRPTLGMRQNGALVSSYVQIPNAIGSPLVVNLVSTDPTVASVPATVTIPQGQTYAYFQITAHDVVGTVQIQASAAGYGPANVNQAVTAPRFLVSTSGTLNTTSPATAIYVAATDAAGNQHYVNEDVTVTLASSSTVVGTIDSATVVIPAGGYFNNNARFRPLSAGTTQISASDARGTTYNYTTGTQNVSVVTPGLGQSWGAGVLTVGVGQWVEPYVSVPNVPASPLAVAVAHSSGASSTPASVTIPTNTTIAYVRVTGVAAGPDTLTFTASGHNGTSGAIAVGQGRVDGISGWPSSLTATPVAVTLYARDQGGNIRNVSAATTFNVAVSSGALELRATSGAGAPLTSVTIPADGNAVTFYLHRLATGSATVTFTNAAYATHVSPTVTVP